MRFCTSSGEGRRPLVQSLITCSARSMSSRRSRSRWTRPRRPGSPSSRSTIWLPMLSLRRLSSTFSWYLCAWASSRLHAGSLPFRSEAAAAGVPVLAVDDLVADVELAEVVEHLLLVLVRLGLEPPPRGLLALPI